MAKFKVLKKCYYAEVKGSRPTLLYPGEVYESDTLKEKDAPSYFKLIKSEGKKAVAPAPKSNDGELSYQEMKSFVIDNEIEVEDQKKETLITAIEAFKNKPSESEEDNANPEDDSEGEGESEE
jgi:hypothetical protein